MFPKVIPVCECGRQKIEVSVFEDRMWPAEYKCPRCDFEEGLQKFILIVKRAEDTDPYTAEEFESILYDVWPQVSRVVCFEVLNIQGGNVK